MSKTLVVKMGDTALSHVQIDQDEIRSTLPGGVYSVSQYMGRSYYDPVEVDNDKPIEVGDIPAMLCGEIRTFFGKKDVFKKFGFAHKRGFLLHGPPGTGKSCLLRLIEDKFVKEFDGVVFVWDGGSLSSMVANFRKFEADRPIMVVAEDIDGCISDFEEEILEFLDGQKALNNFVLVGTTNNLAAIPDRIKNRPSRIDRVIEVPPPPDFARTSYLKNLGLSDEESQHIADNTQGMSMAELKEVVVSVYCLDMNVDEVLHRIGFQRDKNAEVNAAQDAKRNNRSLAQLLTSAPSRY